MDPKFLTGAALGPMALARAHAPRAAFTHDIDGIGTAAGCPSNVDVIVVVCPFVVVVIVVVSVDGDGDGDVAVIDRHRHIFVSIATTRSSSSTMRRCAPARMTFSTDSASSTAPHSIGEPRAMAYARAASALPVRPAASAMLRTMELAARRS